MIVLCDSSKCKHPFQDQRYGKNKRVANPVKSTLAGLYASRCTVCGTVNHSQRGITVKANDSGGGGRRYWYESAETTHKRFAGKGRLLHG